MIGTAKSAHRKPRWKLLKTIALLKLTREGTEEILAVGKIEVTLVFVNHFT